MSRLDSGALIGWYGAGGGNVNATGISLSPRGPELLGRDEDWLRSSWVWQLSKPQDGQIQNFVGLVVAIMTPQRLQLISPRETSGVVGLALGWSETRTSRPQPGQTYAPPSGGEVSSSDAEQVSHA